MSLIQVNDLTFAYEGSYDNIFENVSFQIDTDWRLGFIGRNGRGKTTLLKLLTGQYEYWGSITASVSFDYFPFTIANPAMDTLDVAYSVNEGLALWQLERELNLLEVLPEALHRPFSTLSHGEQTKVLLAVLFLKDEHFLLIDEPTDHLDTHARETVARYLLSKNSFILVSHDRLFLDTCIDHVLSINRGGIEVQSGNFSSWFRNRQQQDQYELEKNRRLKKEIKRLETTAREKAVWSDKVEATKIGGHVGDRGYVGHMAAKAMKRSKTIETRVNRELEEKATLLKNIEKVDDLKVTPLIHHADRLLALHEVCVYYGERRVCGPVTFYAERGDRVAITGRNGSGKSSLLKLCLKAAGILTGDNAQTAMTYTGEVYTAKDLIVSYVSQDTSHLSGSLTDYARAHGLDESFFKAILRKLEFSRIQLEKDMRDFSSGQKKKALIAKSLCERAHIYMWDEPLNFIDVLSRVQIEELILFSQPTMLFVEHDAVFGQKIATKMVAL